MRNTILSILLLLSATHANAQRILFVKEGATGDGSSWEKASGDIQAMINKASVGDQIWIAAGSYYPTQQLNEKDPRSKTFVIKEGVHLYGGFAGNENDIDSRTKTDNDGDGNISAWEFQHRTILSGDVDGVKDNWVRKPAKNENLPIWTWQVSGNEANCYRVITSNGPFVQETQLNGLTIEGGNNTNDGKGGGIYITKNLSINNCVIRNNACFESAYNPAFGGGAYNEGKISNSLFCDNLCHSERSISKAMGGSIYNLGLVENSSIQNSNANTQGYPNSTSCGGGIYNDDNGHVSGCSIRNNISSSMAFSQGGGIFNHAKVSRCQIAENFSYASSSAQGGGAYSYGEMEGCTISDNYAKTHSGSNGGVVGGGVYNDGKMEDCNIYNNMADGSSSVIGGGVANEKNGEVNKCRIEGNKVDGHQYAEGGGICNKGKVHGCVIRNNLANAFAKAFGGGIKNLGGDGNPGLIFGCFVSGNKAQANPNSLPKMAYGGGIENYCGTVVNCVIYNNEISAPIAKGGGTYTSGTSTQGANGYMYCSTIVNNANGNSIQENVSSVIGCITESQKATQNFVRPSTFEGNPSNEAQQQELQQTDWRLKAGSEYIDQGPNIGSSSLIPNWVLEGKDIAGNARVNNHSIDCGAYEYYSDISTELPTSKANNPIAIYSNPTKSCIRIVGMWQGCIIRIYQLSSGELVDVLQTTDKNDWIDVSKLPMGFYLLRTESGECAKWEKE
ncbi:Uncharacterised protein [Porphyromonas crevioricanis]|uniref:Probable pectate lyase C n=1 Tax=Porphyromonas crevioricanis TaxID=393921 RepID=A0A2X4PFS6_9PORP|nr:hypothetical protein [Porphyromonas crevioricanis]GAD06524.1 hypothetical protein PORCAN_120 [Porphyromonas crevioricanis JCM 13913]SQH72766.1 Uncharacterised protein [Porphyromonas crevioricanis]